MLCRLWVLAVWAVQRHLLPRHLLWPLQVWGWGVCAMISRVINLCCVWLGESMCVCVGGGDTEHQIQTMTTQCVATHTTVDRANAVCRKKSQCAASQRNTQHSRQSQRSASRHHRVPQTNATHGTADRANAVRRQANATHITVDRADATHSTADRVKAVRNKTMQSTCGL